MRYQKLITKAQIYIKKWNHNKGTLANLQKISIFIFMLIFKELEISHRHGHRLTEIR